MVCKLGRINLQVESYTTQLAFYEYAKHEISSSTSVRMICRNKYNGIVFQLRIRISSVGLTRIRAYRIFYTDYMNEHFHHAFGSLKIVHTS